MQDLKNILARRGYVLFHLTGGASPTNLLQEHQKFLANVSYLPGSHYNSASVLGLNEPEGKTLGSIVISMQTKMLFTAVEHFVAMWT